MVFLLLVAALLLLLPGSNRIWAEEDQSEEAESDTSAVAEDQEEEGEKEDEEEGPSFKELIEDFEKIEGLFTLYRDSEENKVYMALEPAQFDQLFLCTVTRERGDGYFFDSAAMMYNFPFTFERIGKKVFFTHPNVYYRADQDAAIHRALSRHLSNSIVGSTVVEGRPHPESGAVLVDPSSFFVQDIGMVEFIFTEQIKSVSYRFDGENSYFGTLKSFPENTEIEVVLHFTTSAPKIAVPTLPDSRSFHHTYRYSLASLPETDYRPRLADDRIGHFLTMYQDYTSVLQESPYVRYIDRWHLEKAEPKFKRSPPKRPITFWLENTIPVEYRAAVKEGILLWNDAFERIGFENAIVVKEQADDAEWDPADARYSTVRWMVRPGAGYAVGPSHTNPFTGQIYDADIRISADYLRYIYLEFEEYADPLGTEQMAIGDSAAIALGLLSHKAQSRCAFSQGAVREASFGWQLLQARQINADLEKYLHQLIVDLVSHEVGHTLGLRHNFKASTIHTAAELADQKLTGKEGSSSSVMDYNPVNLAPEGEAQGHYFQTALGPYDYWAIEYAYSPIDAESPESERKILDRIAARVADPDLPYGTDEDAFYSTRGIDPSAARWDLGDDPIQYYRDRIELSRELWRKVEDRFEQKGARYQKLRRVFRQGFRPYWTGVGNVSRYIGGIYHHRDHVGDPNGRIPMVPVSAARQREALAFLTEHIFGANAFAWTPELLNKLAPERWWDFTDAIWNQRRIDYPIHEVVLNIQRQPLHRLYDPLLLSRVQDLELRYEERDPFTMPELFAELRQAIWAELETGSSIDSFRRNLQRAHLDKLVGLLVDPSAGGPEDARALARVDLKEIAAGINALLDSPSPTLDAYSQAHLDETRALIAAALAAELERKIH